MLTVRYRTARPADSWRLLSLWAHVALLCLCMAPLAATGASWNQLTTRNFRHLIIPRDIPSIATAVTQDPTGMIWIGSQDGLVRWDGYRSRVFRHASNDPFSLPSNLINGLFVDKQGTLFVSTSSGVVGRYDAATEHFISLPATSSATGFYIGVASDGAGGIWAGNADGLSHLRENARSWENIALPRDTKVSSLLLGEDGTLWVGTDHGLGRVSTGAHEWKPVGTQSRSLEIRSIHQGADGKVSFGTNDGHVGTVIDSDSIRLSDAPLSSSAILTLAEIGPDTLCAGTAGFGLIFLDRHTLKFRQAIRTDPSRPSGLAGDFTYALYVDHAGGLWVAHGSGVDYLPLGNNAFSSLLPSEHDPLGLSGSLATAVASRPNGDVLVGTEKGAQLFSVSDSDAQPSVQKVFSRGLPAALIYGFSSSTDGNMWIATAQGLFISDGNAARRFEPLGNAPVRSLLRDGDVLWIGLERHGLVRMSLPDRKLTFYNHEDSNPDSLSDNFVLSMVRDPAHGLWIATLHGLNLFDGERFYRFMHDADQPGSIPADTILALQLDRQERLWVATHGG